MPTWSGGDAMLINVHDAKTQLLPSAGAGSTRRGGRHRKDGKPVAKLVPYRDAQGSRSPGAWQGKVHMAPDFDELPPEMAAEFGGERA